MSDPKQQPFVHLHVHTDYSLLDGACRIDRLMNRAAELNQPAVSITDHGNLFGLIDFYKKAGKFDLKPLLGCEIYLVAGDRRLRGDEGRKLKNHHMGLLAKDFRGYQNLAKLVSNAHVEGFYYKPRADMERLAAHAEGLIGFTGCLQGVIPQTLLHGEYDEAREWCGRFVDIFGKENYVVEIQDHAIPEQRTIIPGLLRLAEEFGLRVVCTNDVHYVQRDDSPTHDALLCIQTGSKVKDEKRMRYANDNFYLKSHEEMNRIFGKEFPSSLTNTLEIAEMCDVKLPFGENHYPVWTDTIEVKRDYAAKMDALAETYSTLKNELQVKGGGEADYTMPGDVRDGLRKNGPQLMEICVRGLKERYGVDYHNPEAYKQEDHPAYRPEHAEEKENPDSMPAHAQAGFTEPADYARMLCERLDYELSIIGGTGFVDYFLIVADFIDWANKKGIPVGPGRGSGAGCIVAYLCKITNIDPIRFGLLFERFLNPERVSPPDFDIDFCKRRRDDVVNYVRDKYGKECVANIITFGTFGAKMVVRDVARVLDLPYDEADKIAKMVPDDLNITLDDALEKSAELRTEAKSNPVAKEIFSHGKIIEGMVRNTGKHACGVIIGDRPLDEFIPLTVQEGDLTTQYPKEPVEELGLLKMDFLGLKTLTVIFDAEQNVRHTADENFDIREVGFDDARTFDLLNSGKTVGVFQLESSGMQTLCRQFQISSIDEIIALIALYRPGPMDLIPDYIRGKRDPSTVKYPHKLLEDVCRETYGIMVYQEQVMEAAKIVAGYTLGGADILRRAMGKKKVEVMNEQRKLFIEGAKNTNNIEKRKAEEIFALLEKFAGYGFNKSHSAAYGFLSYQTAYLKANYPVQFMAALLSNELDNADKLSNFIAECTGMGLPVLGPDVNESRQNFTPVFDDGEGKIRFGLAAIKGVGDGAAMAIIAEREKNGPYKNMRDFCERVDGKAVNRRVTEHLAKTGAFDFAGEDRGVLLQNVEGVMKQAVELQRDKEAGQANFFDLMMGGGEPEPGGNGGAETSGLRGDPMPETEKLQHEKDLLGFYVTGHPLDRYAGLDRSFNTHNPEKLLKLKARRLFRVCGVVSGLTKKLSRRDNRPWAIITLGTYNTTLSMHMYADAFERSGACLEEGACLVVEGVVMGDDEDKRLVVENASTLDSALTGKLTKLTWVLKPNGQMDDFLQKLSKTLEQHVGTTDVRLGFMLDENGGSTGNGHLETHGNGKGHPKSRILVADTSGALTWRVSPESFKPLREHPAVVGVHIPIPPPEPKEPKWKNKKKG